MTLTEFLLARIAEDESAAQERLDHRRPWPEDSRVLAECEAKRRIVALHELTVEKVSSAPFDSFTGEPVPPEFEVNCEICFWTTDDPTSGCDTLRLLSLPYADHPSFQEEWRP